MPPLHQDQRGASELLVIRPSTLLDALSALFDKAWHDAAGARTRFQAGLTIGRRNWTA